MGESTGKRGSKTSRAEKPQQAVEAKARDVDTGIYPNGVPPSLPPEVTLSDVIESLPKEVFRKNGWKALQEVAITVISVALSEVLLYYSPWWALPIAWALAGTAFTGMFVIAHDCGHMSFARQPWLNDLVGTLFMLPLVFPFEPWRIQHNLHHNHTNKLHVDNAWQPFQADYYSEASGVERSIMRVIKGPLFWLASVGHWIKRHFALSQFTPQQQARVRVSVWAVYAFAGVFVPALWWYAGVWGVVKYWGVPWVGFHFWMSTFTMIHHTLPHIPFLHESRWTDVAARLTMTVHCEYPKWIEFLCHHINVHVPHHVSTAIPSYNLRAAHNALKAKWGQYMHETRFGLAVLKDITTQCHLYHEDENYVPFAREHDALEYLKHTQQKQ